MTHLDDSENKYSLDELSKRTDVPVRTIRYYIQRDLVPRPCGEKKGSFYTNEHLNTLLQIRKWIASGLTLDRINELVNKDLRPSASMEDGESYPVFDDKPKRLTAYPICSGVTLVIDENESVLGGQMLSKVLTDLYKTAQFLTPDYLASEDLE